MAVQPQLRRLVSTTSQGLADCHAEQMVTIGGIITQHRSQLTKNGDRMAFLTVEDLYGTMEVIVFPETYRQSITHCESEEPLVIWGKVEGDSSDGRVIAQRLLPLREAASLGDFKRLMLNLSPDLDRTVFVQVRDLLQTSPGTCSVVLSLHFSDGERVVLRAADHLNIGPSMPLLASLEELLGLENVRVA